MSLDLETVRKLNAKLDSLMTRFDEFLVRRAANDAHDDDDEDEDEWLDPNETLTPSEQRPWYGDGDPNPLREGSLSRGDK